jgi:indolepyruvate ferredoxin oxidoreductase alpha subunit
MEEILFKKSGKKIMLLGNEAIVRGALESGVQFVSTYPGTPASEIGNTFFQIGKKAGVYFEFSTNEKVALEAAAGASFSGLRSLVAMKHFGLNVASDFLIPLCYSGVKGGMVIVVADDPGCWSSAQSEEDTRAFAYLAHIPILEPSNPQECKDFIKLAFKLSEKFELPIMIRETTRVALQAAPVKLGKIIKEKRKAKFVKEPDRFSTMPPRVFGMKKELLEKIKKIKEISEESSLNEIKGEPSSLKLGIITSGVSYLYVMEALGELKLNIPVLKLGFFHPLPEEKIKNFIKNLKKILIVEELEPYLEKEVGRLAKDVNPKLEIFGKDVIPIIGELKPEIVTLAVANLVNKKYTIQQSVSALKIPQRFPQLCLGCPYWLIFQAVKRVAPKGTIFGGEIGCYMLAFYPPHQLQDYLFCMGSSTSIAHGIKKKSSQKVIAFVGDSSFFHAGIPALINTVYNKSNPLIIIMDNRTTAMTGQQPHPGAPAENHEIKIEDIARAIGVKYVKTIDPQNIKELERTVKEFLDKKEVSVIIARRPCIQIKK